MKSLQQQYQRYQQQIASGHRMAYWKHSANWLEQRCCEDELSINHCGEQLEENMRAKYELRLYSLNVNSPREVHDKRNLISEAFSHYSFENRWSKLEELFDHELKKGTAIFTLQEIDDIAKEKIEKYFQSKGFQLKIDKYCPNANAYYYITAYKENITLTKSEQFYFTLSGFPTSDKERSKLTREEKLARHYNSEFEKSAQLLTFKMVHQDKEIILVNIHPGLDAKYRLQIMDLLGKKLENEKKPVMVTGDLNMFHYDEQRKEYSVYQDQVKVLQNYGFQWASQNLAEQGLQATFVNNPYDTRQFMSEEEKQTLKRFEGNRSATELRKAYLSIIERKKLTLVGVCTDGVFVRGFSGTKVTAKTMLRNEKNLWSIFKPCKPSHVKQDFNEQYVKLIQDTSSEETREGTEASSNQAQPVLPSDHFAMVIKVPSL